MLGTYGMVFNVISAGSGVSYLRQGGNVFARLCLFVCLLAK